MSNLKLWSLIILHICVITGGLATDVYADKRIVKVAVAQNPPIVYKDDDGTFKGLGIGVLNYVAKKEGWQVEYFSRPWAECLAMLERGETDLQAGIAFTQKRANKYDFTKETLFSNWGLIYVRPKTQLASILELEGKTISHVENSTHSIAFHNLLKGLGVNSTFVAVKSNLEVFSLLNEGKVDAALHSRTFGYLHAKDYDLKETSIIFNPIEIRYAVMRGTNPDLIKALDKHLADLKQRDGSEYYQLLARFFDTTNPYRVPKWVMPALVSACFLLLVFSGLAWFQRIRVKQKAREIALQEKVEHALQGVMQGTARTGGRDFFPDLVRYLAKAVEVPYALVAEFTPESKNQAMTLAVWSGNKLADNFTYDLTGTPCANVKQKGLCIYPDGIRQLFPDDFILIEMEAESYIGAPLHDTAGEPLGLLAILDTRPLADTKLAESLLKIFSTRAAMELERLRTEEQLHESRERFRNLVETTVDCVWEIDEHGTYTYVSPRVRDLLGVEPQEVLGKRYCDFLSEAELEKVGPIYQQLLNEKKPFDCLITRKKHSNGSTVVMESSGMPIVDDKGTSKGYRGIDRDITARLQLEDEANRARSLQSLGVMAGGIAHDFNNLMGVMTGYISMAMDDLGKDHKDTILLDKALKAVTTAQELTGRFITFSAGGAPIKTTFSVKELLSQSVLGCELSNHYRVEFLIHDDLWQVELDPKQIAQVFQNVLTNAADAMEGGGIITIRAENLLTLKNEKIISDGVADGNYVKITVQDQGSGIPDQVMYNIFDPYFSTKERGAQKGMGLGLTVALSIVKQHNGYLTVSSEKGTGTSVCIYLPALVQR